MCQHVARSSARVRKYMWTYPESTGAHTTLAQSTEGVTIREVCCSSVSWGYLRANIVYHRRWCYPTSYVGRALRLGDANYLTDGMSRKSDSFDRVKRRNHPTIVRMKFKLPKIFIVILLSSLISLVRSSLNATASADSGGNRYGSLLLRHSRFVKCLCILYSVRTTSPCAWINSRDLRTDRLLLSFAEVGVSPWLKLTNTVN